MVLFSIDDDLFDKGDKICVLNEAGMSVITQCGDVAILQQDKIEFDMHSTDAKWRFYH